MRKKTLWTAGSRYLLRHPWQLVLMVLGITLGVAVVTAVDLANASASRAFDLSTEAVAGKATHQISAGPNGLDEALYARLQTSGLRSGREAIAMAPVVLDYVSSPQLGGQALQLLGVDPFSDAPFRTYLNGDYGGDPACVAGRGALDLAGFLTRPGAVLLAQETAKRYSVTVGQTIIVEVAGQPRSAFVAGLLTPADAFTQRALEGLILADIATAQELTGSVGRLDHIDLILPENDPRLLERLASLLPPEARLETVAARSGAVEQMTSAFRVNLTALSLLALVVGMFLIYNTMTFSVIQRRPLFGVMRCLGVTRAEVFWMVMSEALLLGVVGALLGVILGIFMGQGAVRLVTQTINDLFFVVTVRGVQIPIQSLVKGATLGVFATLISAAPPAWEAAASPPRAALSRSGLESKARQAVRVAALAGAGLILFGTAVLLLITRSLMVSFFATFVIVVGFAMLTPIATGFLMKRASPPLGWIAGSLGRMAPRDVLNSLSRTAVAVMALMVAVSVTIGVSVMVSSFRGTVISWLSETLQGDVYISVPGIAAITPTAAIEPAAVDLARTWSGVERLDVLRSVQVAAPDGPVELSATDNYSLPRERIFLRRELPIERIWPEMLKGGVLVSEPYANRTRLPARGGAVTLSTPDGPRQFPVLGVYYDYSSTQGTVLMALPLYQSLWNDEKITAMALCLKPGEDPDAMTRRLQDGLAPLQRLAVRANRSLRDEVLKIFDRTFAITGALQLLATIVAFIGVLSSLLSLELERQRELGILRAVGLTARQLWGLVLLETGLMGGVAGLLSMPTGYALALILVYIINRRSFGWTLQMQVEPTSFLQALVVAVTAALLAGLYPAWRMGRMVTSEALRSE